MELTSGEPYADAFLGNDAAASSSLAYTVIALSSLVRRSNSVKYILEDTSLASPSRPPVRVKRRTRAARPVLSTRSTLVRLRTTLRFSDNSLWTLSQNAVVACPATRSPTQRKMITSPQIYVSVLSRIQRPFHVACPLSQCAQATCRSFRSLARDGNGFSCDGGILQGQGKRSELRGDRGTPHLTHLPESILFRMRVETDPRLSTGIC